MIKIEEKKVVTPAAETTLLTQGLQTSKTNTLARKHWGYILGVSAPEERLCLGAVSLSKPLIVLPLPAAPPPPHAAHCPHGDRTAVIAALRHWRALP